MCVGDNPRLIYRVTRIRNNSLYQYVLEHKMRTLLSLFYVLAIPVLTILWFVNKITLTLEQENMDACFRLKEANWAKCRSARSKMIANVHPIIFLIFAYHCDVLWINLTNLIMVQMLLVNISHYQDWLSANRPKMMIQLNI